MLVHLMQFFKFCLPEKTWKVLPLLHKSEMTSLGREGKTIVYIVSDCIKHNSVFWFCLKTNYYVSYNYFYIISIAIAISNIILKRYYSYE